MDIIVVETDSRLERNWAARLTRELPSMHLTFLTLNDIEQGTYRQIPADTALIVAKRVAAAHMQVARRLHPMPCAVLFEEVGDYTVEHLPPAEVQVMLVRNLNDEQTYQGLLLKLRLAGRSDRYAEMKLRTLLDNLDAGVLFEDRHGLLQHVNERLGPMFGLGQPLEEFVGGDCNSLAQRMAALVQAPDDFGQQLQALRSQLQPARTEWRLGDGRTLLQTYAPVYSAGQFAGHLWQYLDITWQKQAEEALVLSRRQAEDSTRAKERFLANMSHEIRTPLNGIIGLTHLLGQSQLNREQQEFVQALYLSGDHLLRLINDILDLSKITSGKLEFEQIDFDVHDLMAQLHRQQQHRAEEKQLAFRLQVDPDVPQILRGDPTRLGQILTNLVTNALKFTERGSVHLQVQLEALHESVAHLAFLVRDTGIGIAQDRLATIFDSFTQASPETTRRYGGTGLGLAIVRELVHLMGGSVDVDSSLGAGTTFRVRLRLQALATAPAVPANTQSDSGNPAPRRGTRPSLRGCILLVEDHPVNQMIASRLLTNWGLTLDLAETGTEAIHLLRSRPYDLILMDLRLPEYDGLELTEMVRKSDWPNRQVPILAVTAQLLADERDKCLAVGMNDFISKPFDPEDLYRRVVALLPDHAGQATGLDLAYLRQFFNGDEVLVQEILQMSQHELRQDLLQLTAAATDALRVSRIAHRLKTTLRQLGDKAGAELLAALELDGTHGIVLPDRLAAVQAHIETVIVHLQALAAHPTGIETKTRTAPLSS